ncbi:Importin subunit alpha [Carpediemonas membranifera]|uniref:Importin subunit alpha n=1 Tax=Carpediemonas membranifera TaxID=201153 RepID=A0A8J6B0Z8_9EUKA|nr:Importin subunit alpha [Carpediemonas membranifera]|eukprot:KAG9396105.1 Importin subunit alpha [Carpediemonas membranifera]
MADHNVRKGFDAVSGRRSRTNELDSIRKKKRDNAFDKMSSSMSVDFHGVEESIDETMFDACMVPSTPEEFMFCANQLRTNDLMEQLKGAFSLRKAAAKNTTKIFQLIVDTGIVPTAVTFLDQTTSDRGKVEVAWVLTNLASNDEFTQLVITAGTIPVMMRTLTSPNFDVAIQAAWCLGNFANEGDVYRQDFIRSGVPASLAALFAHPKCVPKHTSTVAWAIGSIARLATSTTETVKLHHACHVVDQQLFAALTNLDHRAMDKQTLSAVHDILLTVGHLSSGDDEDIGAVLNAGFAKPVIQLLYGVNKLARRAISIIGNLTSGDNDAFVTHLIDVSVLPGLEHSLQSDYSGIQRESLWAISNIFAGTEEHMAAALAQGLLPIIIQCLRKSDADVKSEAALCLLNFTSNATQEAIDIAVQEYEFLETLAKVCQPTADTTLLVSVLDAAKNVFMLEASTLNNTYAVYFESAGGYDRLTALSHHAKLDVASRADELLKTYYDGDDDFDFEDDDEFHF